jgi:muramoyltetrapeptide carboxypeptidase
VPGQQTRIGVMAPGSRIEEGAAERVRALAADLYPDGAVALVFHPQCFLSSGHFAGDDAARAAAFLEIANDERYDALWFARGGYGSCRLAEAVLPRLTAAARRKLYLGYSDVGALLAGLYKDGFEGLAHGPMPGDIVRPGGAAAVGRALAYLVARAPEALEAGLSEDARSVAFNITVLSQLLGTPLQPDLADHALLLEEVSEYMYRIDRSLFHITGNPGIRRAAGIRLGRCSDIPPNDPDFGQSEEEVVRHWCAVSGIPYLGRADIGHDIDNKVVPFGNLRVARASA